MKKLIARTPETFREKHNIDAHIRHEVIELDLTRRRVHVEDNENHKDRWEPFDQLLIATGSSPFLPSVPGADAGGIYGVSTLESGLKVRKAVDETSPKRAVIIGGGYIGLEMAEALILRKLEVSLVERGPQVMNTLDPDMGKLVSDALMNVGVTLYREESLESFEVNNGNVSGVVTDKRTLPADLVILGMGVKPNSDLAAGGYSARLQEIHQGRPAHANGYGRHLGRRGLRPMLSPGEKPTLSYRPGNCGE